MCQNVDLYITLRALSCIRFSFLFSDDENAKLNGIKLNRVVYNIYTVVACSLAGY